MRNVHVSLALATCAIACSAFAGEKNLTPVTADQGIQVTAKRFARIAPDFKQTSPWMEVGDLQGPSACPPTALAFDCFEPDGAMPGFPTDGLYGLDCGLGTGRWYFGSSYCNMFTVNDMTVAPGFEGAMSERMETGWWWFAGGPGTSEQCLIAVFTADGFDDTCAGPPSTSGYSGVIFDFGVLPYGGYYWTDTEDLLCGSGLFFQMPMDGSGSYTSILANDFNGNTIFLATCGQTMLWGTKPGNPSQQGPIQWDDDNPSDGTHTAPDECYDYAFALCPDPLGAMMCFYAEGGSVDCLDLSIDNEFAGTPSTFTVTGGTPNAQVALYYTLIDPGDVLDCLAEEYRRCRDGGGSWLKCIGVAIANCTKRAVQYARGTFDSTGTFQDTLAVPCAAGDKTVWFFGVSQGPDGEVDCYSDALEVTFAALLEVL